MVRHSEPGDPSLGFKDQTKSKSGTELTREVLFLAEQAREGDLRVLPGHGWSLHYPKDVAVRQEKLQGVLDGKYDPDDVASEIYVKIPDNLADEAALIAPWSEAYVVGQIWKMPPFEAGGEDFRAITAQTIWSNEKVVNAPPISASTLVPQSDEKDFA